MGTIPRSLSLSAQDLLAERRAVINEMRHEESKIGRAMLEQDIERIDDILAELRGSR